MNCASLAWSAPPEHLALPIDEVHVWRVALDLETRRIKTLLDLLSPDERERATRFHFPIHRQRFIAARGLLRTVLARYVNTSPQSLRFSYGPHGKPALADAASAEDTLKRGLQRERRAGGLDPGTSRGGVGVQASACPASSAWLCFNVAHSEGLALFAVAHNREVGIDVESLLRKLTNDQIAERFFSPKEVAALRALPVELQRQGFFNCWTRKEAYIKARGKGLSLPLDQFTVSLAPGEPARLLETAGEPDEALKWTLRDLPLPMDGDFVAALAVEGSGWRLCCWECHLPAMPQLR
jgi:4'-phosphopantetheinyl transferase